MLNATAVLVETANDLLDQVGEGADELSQEEMSKLIGSVAQKTIELFEDIDNNDSDKVAEAMALAKASNMAMANQISNGLQNDDDVDDIVIGAEVTAEVVVNTLSTQGALQNDELDQGDIEDLVDIIISDLAVDIASIGDDDDLDDLIETLTEQVNQTVDVLIENIESGVDVTDLDGDGIANADDPDIDGDGVANDVDAFAYDASEQVDADMDGRGDNSDVLISNEFELSGRNQTELLGLSFGAVKKGDDIIVPDGSGLYIFNEADLSTNKAPYKIRGQDQIKPYNFWDISHGEVDSNNDLWFAGWSFDQSVLMRVDGNSGDYDNITFNLIYVVEMLEGGGSQGHTDFVVENFTISSDNKYLFAYLTDYSTHYFASYQISSDGTLTLVNMLDVTGSGYPHYESNFTLSENEKWLYGSFNGEYSSGNDYIVIAQVSESDGSLTLVDFQDMEKSDFRVIQAVGNNRLLVTSETQASLMSIDEQWGTLSALSSVTYENKKPFNIQLNGSKNVAMVSTFDGRYANSLYQISIDDGGDLSFSEIAEFESAIAAGVYSTDESRYHFPLLYNSGIRSLDLSTEEVNTTLLGITNFDDDQLLHANNGYLFIYETQGANPTIVDSESSDLPFTDIANEFGGEFLTKDSAFYMGVTDSNTAIGNIKSWGENNEMVVNNLMWKWNDDFSEIEITPIETTSTDSTFDFGLIGMSKNIAGVASWAVDSSEIMGQIDIYHLDGDSGDVIEMTSVFADRSAYTSFYYYENLTLPNGIAKGTFHFNLESDPNSVQLTTEQFANTALYQDGSVFISQYDMSSSYEVFVVSDTYNRTLINSYTTNEVIDIEKWSDSEFVTLERIVADSSEGEGTTTDETSTVYIRFKKVDENGVVEELSSALLQVSIDPYTAKIKVDKEKGLIWLATFNDNKDLLLFKQRD